MKIDKNNSKFELVKDKQVAKILVEADEYEGVRMIADKSANDIEMVTGILPEIISEKPEQCKNILVYATIGKSKILEQLEEENKLSLENVKDKREVFGIKLIHQPFQGIENMLLIYGSEKRGTIYGIFTLSEIIGVSPLVYWGDVKPVHRDELILGKEIEQISKEPSVKYRGFFINDEWPCFGNWTFDHFDGFTSEMYDKVFELLLRLKGNYLWPAMWTSSFALDGPGEENSKLADLYGVIIGNSHHEPCLRASEEWDIYRGEDSVYGNEWNYVSNKEGLLKYWEDGLKRSGKYESIITVGMRGERDSSMEGTETLQDNIDVLKDIIENQKSLIEENVEKDAPLLLAIYKEVEEYFYGDDQISGLREWDGLDDIILMLCDDNYGNMRTLPDEKMLEHTGGYGMYFHLDYHGSPVSYEWVNSTPLTKIWEQMTQCYEHGVREVWMVNVGDLKHNEFPLSYFMALAYDFDKWGTDEVDSPHQFTKDWIKCQFEDRISKKQSEILQKTITTGIRLNYLRRPEALNSRVYHPVHYHEADRVLSKTKSVIDSLNYLKTSLPDTCQPAFLSIIYYSLSAAMNLIQMQVYAGKNEHYSRQGKKIANLYKDKVSDAIQQDKILGQEFANLFDGKWKGMELAPHIGFTKWNEDGCRYPLLIEVKPFDKPRMVVSRSDKKEIYLKNYGENEKIYVKDFLYPGTKEVYIEVANDGLATYTCRVDKGDCSWLSLSWEEKEIHNQELLVITCNEDELPIEKEKCTLLLSDGDTEVDVIVYGKKNNYNNLPPMTFYEKEGLIAVKANNYSKLISKEIGEFKLLKDFGKTGHGLKAFPLTENYDLGKGPEAEYLIAVEEEGDYNLEVWSSPSNPLLPKGRLNFGYRVNNEDIKKIPSVPDDYLGGEPSCEEWSMGVLNQIHKTNTEVYLNKGLNKITFYPVDAGFVLEGFIIFQSDLQPLKSYQGPIESWHS